MFRVKRLRVDTLSEHVIVIHQRAVREGNLGFNPLDRATIFGISPSNGEHCEITGILNFCLDSLIAPDEIGLSEQAFHDLGLPEGTQVSASLAAAPRSVDLVRAKLNGGRLDRAAFDAILFDVVGHRYSRVELSMFVLACSLRRLDPDELVDYTRAMIGTGECLDFGAGPIVDKHCVGGVPGNRTTMVIVPILASLGITVPKTSSRAITSPAGTADTMGALAEVALAPDRLRSVVSSCGGCIAWGGALKLAPADDILITVERPMELDTEAQMVASILAKKKSVGATHVLIDIPIGPSAKIRSHTGAQSLAALFRAVAEKIGLLVEVAITHANGPIGFGIGPRLEALDVLAVLRRDKAAPVDLREKSLYLAARALEMSKAVAPNAGYRAAERVLDSGEALRKFEQIAAAQGQRELPPPAPYTHIVTAPADGRISAIDCWEIARIAKQAGAPANASAGVRLLRSIGDIVSSGDPLFEIHSESAAQLEFARAYAISRSDVVRFGF